MAEYIMLQGTSSHVGKSILATALCRIFFQEGKRVVPFKAQNMALNSFVTADGREMGRAQVAQAEAAGLLPSVEMNPVLLKPTGNSCSQVIIDGYPVGNMSAKEYHQGYSLKAFDAVTAALQRLQMAYDTIVIEGAGSPAEVNLKDHDIVNMRVAKYLSAPVLLVADIDRGGSLAALVGTLELLDEEERKLVKGLIINKFRGDISLFEPAVSFLEQKTGKPVLGVIPFIEDLGIDDEDSVSLEEKQHSLKTGELHIAVIQLPKLSNFTDFDSLAAETDVSLYYVTHPDSLGQPDVIILPGSKNTAADMAWLRETGLADAICRQLEKSVPVIGICGGYQMLGQWIHDPLHTESSVTSTPGLGLLPVETTFAEAKSLSQVQGVCQNLPFVGTTLSAPVLKGYEIHMGQTTDVESGLCHPIVVTERKGQPCHVVHSTARKDGLVWGTYMHGIFDNDGFRQDLLNSLRRRKGLPPLLHRNHVQTEKERHYDQLAQVVRDHLDMTALRRMMAGSADHD